MPALGLDFSQSDAEFIVATSTTVTQGQILSVDETWSDSGTLSDNIGSSDGSLARAIEPLTYDQFGGRLIVVALHNALVGTQCRCRIRGIVYILLSGTYAAGDVIVLGVTSGTTAKRIFGQVLESGGSAGEASYARVLWDGDIGFGTFVPSEAPGGDPDYPLDDSYLAPAAGVPGGGGGGGGGPKPPQAPGTVPISGVGIPFAVVE